MFADDAETFGPPSPAGVVTGPSGGGGVLSSLVANAIDLVKAGTPIVTRVIEGQNQIRAQQAARQIGYGGYVPGGTVNPALAQYYGQQSGSTMYLIMAGIAALGVGAFILTRKK